MLGPRAVGKTSLLVSLYDQFQDVVGATALELSTSDHATRTIERFQRSNMAVGSVQNRPGYIGA